MICPYRTKSIKHVETTEQNLVDEETGITRGSVTVLKETYDYCKCEMENCAVFGLIKL